MKDASLGDPGASVKWYRWCLCVASRVERVTFFPITFDVTCYLLPVSMKLYKNLLPRLYLC